MPEQESPGHQDPEHDKDRQREPRQLHGHNAAPDNAPEDEPPGGAHVTSSNDTEASDHRSGSDGMPFTLSADGWGDPVVLPGAGHVDFESRIVSGLSKFHSQVISDLTRKGKDDLARTGIMPGGVGPALFGYGYNAGLRCREVNLAEAKVVIAAYQDCDAGFSHEENLARNFDGVLTRQGHPWTRAKLIRMLHNTSYIGLDFYGKTRTVRHLGVVVRKEVVPTCEWIRIPDFTPPLIPVDLFMRVQRRLSKGFREYGNVLIAVDLYRRVPKPFSKGFDGDAGTANHGL